MYCLQRWRRIVHNIKQTRAKPLSWSGSAQVSWNSPRQVQCFPVHPPVCLSVCHVRSVCVCATYFNSPSVSSGKLSFRAFLLEYLLTASVADDAAVAAPWQHNPQLPRIFTGHSGPAFPPKRELSPRILQCQWSVTENIKRRGANNAKIS